MSDESRIAPATPTGRRVLAWWNQDADEAEQHDNAKAILDIEREAAAPYVTEDRAAERVLTERVLDRHYDGCATCDALLSALDLWSTHAAIEATPVETEGTP